MNSSRGHLRFHAGGRESFLEQRADEIRVELLLKHERELHGASFLRRWLLRWKIEREAFRLAALEQPSGKALFFAGK